jgi:hypothetical protein
MITNHFYNIDLSLEIIKKDSIIFNNIEIEVIATTEMSNFTIKKLIYLEGKNRLVELFWDIVLFPFRLFGYYDSKHFNIRLLEDYNNNLDMLKNLKIIIKDYNVNIKLANIVLSPQINIFRKWIYSLRYVILISMLCIITIIQIVALLIIWYYYRKTYLNLN